MKAISAVTHEFRRGKANHDDSSLYTSVHHVNGSLEKLDNDFLQDLVSKRLRRKGNLPAGIAELQALTVICRLVIRVVSMTKNAEGNVDIKILNYGEDEKSFTECVYIVYDEENKHYDPLYVINKENSDEKLTLFQRNDKVVGHLLDTFIQREFDCCHSRIYEKELSTETNLLKETEQMYNMIIPQTTTNLSNKRKILDHANLSFGKDTKKAVSSSLSNNNDVFGKPTKFARRDVSEILVSDTLKATTDSSVILNKKLPEDKMKFEVEPILKFRGRTPGNFKPTKALKRNGQPSEEGPPRYFADRDNHHYFNLLIPEKYLSSGAEHRLKICLITREIDGCTYIHPYFKFSVRSTNQQISYQNSIDITFDMTELKDYEEGIKQFKIQLVVIMHKNPDLMRSEQPLRIFSSLNNGSPITTIYNKHGAFKDAYHLHDLRFAVTLCKKQPGEKEFRQCDDIQCISEISTEDQKYKSSGLVNHQKYHP